MRVDDYSATNQNNKPSSNTNTETGRVKRHTEQQISAIVAQSRAGVSSSVLCERYGISRRTLYRWKRRDNVISAGRSLLDLQQENTALKVMIGELSLENQLLKKMFLKK
jgi:DNA-binding transcriptional regulator YiaG